MFSALTLFSGPYALLARWAVLLIACAVLFGTGYVKGHHSAELDFEKFKGGVEALGKEAEKRTANRITLDKTNREKTDATHKDAVVKLRTTIASLRKQADSRRSELPAAPANSSRPDLICLDREEYQRAWRDTFDEFRDGVRALFDEGTASTVDLDAAKTWALRMSTTLR